MNKKKKKNSSFKEMPEQKLLSTMKVFSLTNYLKEKLNFSFLTKQNEDEI